MSNPASVSACARRWDALLAENQDLHREYLALLASSTQPLSLLQKAQLEASAARRAGLQTKIKKLVEDWTKIVLR